MKNASEEHAWNRLLAEIEEQKIIPVIGPELLVVNSDGKDVLLYHYLARELAQRLDVETSSLGPQFSLNDVACAYLARHGDRTDIYYQIREIMASRNFPTPEPLKKLAAITHFDLYLSTTFDLLMKQALDEMRFGGADRTRLLAYSNRDAVVDLPEDFDQQKRPLVFQLFGRVSTSPDYAVTEDDILEFNHRLQTRDFQPQNLFDRLRSKYLLKLGCSFSDWLARFFYCATKGDLVFSERSIRGVVADTQSSTDNNLCRFLERKNTRIYKQGGGLEFVDELHRRWMERFGGKPQQPPIHNEQSVEGLEPFEADAIFLSYASEDRKEVFNLKTSLEAAGIDVWVDQHRLEAGDDYKAKIFRNIENCSFFMPVISQNTITLKRRFFRLEWNKAIEEAGFRPTEYPFLQPIVIDDTSQNAPYIPEEFKRRHWQRFEKGHPNTEFLDLTRERIRNLRRQKRDST